MLNLFFFARISQCLITTNLIFTSVINRLISHLLVLSWAACLSAPDLFSIYFLGPSTEITGFHAFKCLNTIPFCAYTTLSLLICLLIGCSTGEFIDATVIGNIGILWHSRVNIINNNAIHMSRQLEEINLNVFTIRNDKFKMVYLLIILS